MHKQIEEYCKTIKNILPTHFKDKKVLDVGSLDINGNNRYLFEDCFYIWVDLWEWPNVDIVIPIHKLEWEEIYDTIISTEMLEHNQYYIESLINMNKLLKRWWLLLITCATTWRNEHWTSNTSPKDAPFTNDYYKNIVESDFDCIKNDFNFEISILNTDLRFYGIKK